MFIIYPVDYDLMMLQTCEFPLAQLVLQIIISIHMYAACGR